MKRILTALVGLPILLFTVWTSIPHFFVILVAVAALLALREFFQLAAEGGAKAQQIPGYLAGLLIIACFFSGVVAGIVAVIAILAILSLTVELVKAKDLTKSLTAVAVTLLGVGYVILLAGYLVGVRMLTDSYPGKSVPHLAAKLLTMFFAMVMLTDTGAYYTGRSIGRHKLAPRISPGKTIEGSVGGLVAAMLTGPLCHYTFFYEIPLLDATVLGGILGIVGQVGDLAESLLKRGANVKDSGHLLPGHGGMLDRIDSILFCAPVLYYYAHLFLSKW